MKLGPVLAGGPFRRSGRLRGGDLAGFRYLWPFSGAGGGFVVRSISMNKKER